MNMKRGFVRSLWLALFVTVVGCAVGYAQPGGRDSAGRPESSVSISYFYDNLAPYGEWINNPSYGWVWTPYDMSAGWRPYTDGCWQYTDYGWSWASNEPWGWAPYHYGRWFFDDNYGWVWVPGTEWAPAWVAWRYGNDWVGWAPLPPMARWDASAGLSYGDADRIPSPEWCFVPRTHVLDVQLRLQVTSVARNVTLLSRSHDATRFEVRNGRPANVGIDVSQIESNGGQRVPRARVVDISAPGRGSGQSAGRGNVGFFRPVVQPAVTGQAPPNARVDRPTTIPTRAVQQQRIELRQKVESDLRTEQARLARDQRSELRAQGSRPGIEEIRKNQAAEQQAFQAHAVQQRRVVMERTQQEIMKPGRANVKSAVKPTIKGKGTPSKPTDQGKSENRGGQGNR
jgi:hypothetical protein